MKLKLETTFQTREGKKIITADNKELTAGDLLLMAMDFQDPTRPIFGEERYARYRLGNKIADAMKDSAIDFAVDEVAQAKAIVGLYPFNTVVHGRLCDFLDQKESVLKAVK